MRKVLGRIIALVAVIALSLTVAQGYVAKAADETITVYVTIEKTSIGQGYLVEPARLVVPEGTTAMEAIQKAANDGTFYNYELKFDGYGYISGIAEADDGVIDIPDSISNLAPYTSWKGDIINPPSNDSNDGNADDDLDSFDYNATSGWMGFINNESASTGLSDIELKDNDVVRLQFSVFGYGLDLGTSWDPSIETVTVANKDSLIRAAADLWELADWSSDVENEYDSIIDALENHDLTQDAADTLFANLKYYPVETEETTTVEETTTEVTTTAAATTAVETTTATESTTVAPSESATSTDKVVKPAKAKIKKVAKKKKSAKKLSVTLKKVTGAVGYQVAVFKSKKDAKKAKKMLAKKFAKKVKVTLKSKKLKNKKKLFVRARAYVLDNKTKVFGDWSAVKKVKVK